MDILVAFLVVFAIALVLGILLALVSHFFYVPEDPTKAQIRACLPGVNCGACGYTGCDEYAAALVQMVELLLKKFSPSLHKGLGVYLPLITTNCAVLGVAINNINDGFTYVESLVSALGVGLGFLLAMVLFSGLRTRIHDANVPAPFRGLPVTLIAASFISLAFMGFGGIVENIFK